MSPWVERKSDGGAPLLLVLLPVISRFLCHTCVLFHHDLAGTHENWPTKHKPNVLNGWPSGTFFRCQCLSTVQFRMVSMRFKMWCQFGSHTWFLFGVFFWCFLQACLQDRYTVLLFLTNKNTQDLSGRLRHVYKMCTLLVLFLTNIHTSLSSSRRKLQCLEC